jgi:hypothetical protein
MKKGFENKKPGKRIYTKPSVEQIKVDNEISIFMLTPPPDPGGKLEIDNLNINPFKLLK